MCQDALQELKMRVRASGEHKQRILIQITVDGLKIKDEKSGVTIIAFNELQVLKLIVKVLRDRHYVHRKFWDFWTRKKISFK
jgi:hypothetical protein